jgi:Phage integrase, N-terminal SAM-like domain
MRRGGFGCEQAARAAAAAPTELLAVPDVCDERARLQVADLLLYCTLRGGVLPDRLEVQARYRAGMHLGPVPTVGEWLVRWLEGKRGLRRSTRAQYEAHIRLYLNPYLGRIRLDQLRVDHLAEMFRKIDLHNDAIRDARAGGDRAARVAVKWQKPASATTRQRIRAVLRGALTSAVGEQLLTVNVGPRRGGGQRATR